MKTNRTGITRLTTGQCTRIVGGDPGMCLAGAGNGSSGGGFSAGDMAMAAAGIGYACGPMVSVSIGLPGNAPLTGFDTFLIGLTGTVVGGATGLFVGAALTGVGAVTIAAPVGVLAAAAAGQLASDGAKMCIQYANNQSAYAGHVRRATP